VKAELMGRPPRAGTQLPAAHIPDPLSGFDFSLMGKYQLLFAIFLVREFDQAHIQQLRDGQGEFQIARFEIGFLYTRGVVADVFH
jgi:hypothetical protein